jgi:hypothetical protein
MGYSPEANFSPSSATWQVKWGKETIIQPSAFDVLAIIGERSYNPMDRKHPKRGIAYRVFVQYRILIDDEMSDEAFLMRLAEFGLIELTVRGEAPADLLQEAWEFSEAWNFQPKKVK